jgi:hypothetical protein
MTHRPDVDAVAHLFARGMLNFLGRERLAEADRMNADDPDYRFPVCASHNFCDANLFMAGAFEEHLGVARGALTTDAVALADWDAAWAIARALGFVAAAGRALDADDRDQVPRPHLQSGAPA